ncbi:alpha/beta-hydrolase [Paraphaeosphaeria sporulosa]|uniref:Alpha/beta-hydrolase n=1 Tax=Paraphaeosphaeria sporulosa TaxID=1460663 RepID=A0A177CL50_9PLEO|nr:alpha/beta-hydrolase [Paraphaeosphaeria sporulosa]OAG07580.1 alpha/beta-hydrolase [Paraphaeosphaeria sporulosa]
MTAYTLQKELQSVVLPSGHRLAFAEYGKPNGRPVIYLHGFPMCRLEGMAFDVPASRANIRIIALDRPGIGRSSFVANRAILDHAEDVRVLSQHLDLRRFGILGVSGGAPYALACARALPKELLSGVGILSGMGTYEETDIGLVPMPSRVTGWLARNIPRTLRVVTDAFVAGLQRVVKWSWVQKRLDRFVGQAKQSKNAWERDALGTLKQQEADENWTATASRERLLKAIFEPFHQGSEGVVQEAALVSQPWGFRLEEIENTVTIWHGSKDTNAPIEWIRAMARKVPGAVLNEYEGDTHGSMVKHVDDVFGSLIHKVDGDYNDEASHMTLVHRHRAAPSTKVRSQ